MLDAETKRRIDSCRDILVARVPDPKSEVEQITIALINKFMDNMGAEAEELGGLANPPFMSPKGGIKPHKMQAHLKSMPIVLVVPGWQRQGWYF